MRQKANSKLGCREGNNAGVTMVTDHANTSFGAAVALCLWSAPRLCSLPGLLTSPMKWCGVLFLSSLLTPSVGPGAVSSVNGQFTRPTGGQVKRPAQEAARTLP